MNHRRAVLTVIVATLLWSIAGIVTRHLDSARSFEVTFWRSAFNAIGLIVLLSAMRGPRALLRSIGGAGRVIWLSGLCWALMYTAFMVALTMTTVANVMVTESVAPLFTALIARVALGHRLPARTWLAIAVAGIGIAWMYGSQVVGAEVQHLYGTLVALAIPVAAAVNWTVIQSQSTRGSRGQDDLLVAVLLGAVLSALVSLPLALPLASSAHDVGLLAMLGIVQLAIPCVLVVRAARVLPAPEVALLALLEIVFAVAWAWLGTSEQPSMAVIGGGGLVLAALALNEALALRDSRRR